MDRRKLRTAIILSIAATVSLSGVSTNAQDLEAAREAIRLRDFSSAFEILSKLEQDLEASYLAAGLQRRGLGTSRDVSGAAETYTALAARGHDPSVALQQRDPTAQWPALIDPQDRVSALFWCAQTGRAEPAKTLLEGGVDANSRSSGQRTPLMEAAESGHTEMITLLLEHGANADLTDDSGNSALLLAARLDQRPAVSTLLASGADADLQDEHGNSALIVAVRKNNDALARLLLEAGSNVNRANGQGQTALGIAKIRGHHRIGALLERHGGVAEGFVSTQRSGQGALQLAGTTAGERPIWFVAADRGNAAAISQLLRGGAKVDRTDETGTTALMIAVERDHEALVDLLLANGANPKTARPGDGWTALHFAATSGRAHLLTRMLERTLPPFPATAAGVDPLMLAIDSEHRETIALLLNQDDPVSAADNVGRTALMRAASRPMSTVVADLIASGADVSARDQAGRSALWYAADNGLHENVGLLVRTGASVTAVDRDGNGPLHRAAHHGHERVVKPLLRAGDATQLENESGSTPLMIAAMRRHMRIVRDLVTSGHDLDHQNRVGNTAILIAAQRGDAEVVDALLKLGADPGIVNHGRLNVADVADRFGHRSVAGVLEQF